MNLNANKEHTRKRQKLIALSAILLLINVAYPPSTIATAQSQPVGAPSSSGISVAIIEPEVLADLPADQRKALAGTIDTLLNESLSKQKGLVLVDRQALDKVLAEKAAKVGGIVKVPAGEVGAELRPFWSAGVLVCPVVRQVNADKDETPGNSPELLIEIDVVLAQTGQPLGDAHALAKWKNRDWEKAPPLEAPLTGLWAAVPESLRQAQASRYVEIAEVQLTSSLGRLQWMADSIGDDLRASLVTPGVTLLRPRHPSSTKEERLLRIMGMASPIGKDAAAALTCSPDWHLDVELVEDVGNDMSYDKTPIKVNLTLQGRQGPPVTTSLSGMASQYIALSDQASAWLNKQLGPKQLTRTEEQDQEVSRQMARRELEAARQLLKDCCWYSGTSPDPGPEHFLRARILEHALRASHLDPTNEEAARLAALGIDSLYAMRGTGRKSVCADRVIAEGQRYLDRFGKSRNAAEIRHHISNVAFAQLTEIRQHGQGDWISVPQSPEVWRYGKVAAMGIEWDLKEHIVGNLWADAALVGECILTHCPADRLEDERAFWRTYWKKTIEPIADDVPPWEFIDVNYFIRKKDCPGLHETLNELARRYPRSHQVIWWGTGPYPEGSDRGKPCWKVRVERFLKLCGDKDWQTWEPTFPAETFTWNLHDFRRFAERLNPPMPRAWDMKDALPLPGAKIILHVDTPKLPLGWQRMLRPLLTSGGYMWLCEPPPLRPDEKQNASLCVVPLKELETEGQDVIAKAQAVPWPDLVADGDKNSPPLLVQCWTESSEGDVPTVWVGTNYRGLARFELKDAKWNGRWYAAEEGIPGEDILMVRPCLHEGKCKLLILSQPRQPRPNDFQRFLWVLDPSDGRISTVLTSSKWDMTWYKYNVKQPEYMALVAVWKNRTRVPLSVYDVRSFPKLDVADIVSLEKDFHGFAMAREEPSRSVWRFTGGGLVQFDDRWTAKWLLNSPPTDDDVFFYASADKNSRFAVNISGCGNWRLLRAPMIDMECSSGPPAVAWGTVGLWDEVRYGCSILAAYRPASKAPLGDNDAWYGPWKTDKPVLSVDFIGGLLWVALPGGELRRFSQAEALAQAEKQGAVRTTAKWSPEYQRRAESSWLDSVRMCLTLKEYDQALAVIAASRKMQPVTTQPTGADTRMDLYEGLTHARKGDLIAADRTYLRLADDVKAEPYARGLAMMGLVNVRLAGRDLAGMNIALDKLVTMFPGLNSPDHFSEAKTIQWYHDQARRSSTASQPNRTSVATSRPDATVVGR